MARKTQGAEIADHVEEQATGTDGPPAKKSVLERLRDKTQARLPCEDSVRDNSNPLVATCLETELYLAATCESQSTNVMDWWRVNKATFPHLA